MKGKALEGRRYKIIINEPRVIYILNTRFGKFKGIALCQPEDEFNRDIGVQIAYTKAKMKELRAREKELLRFLEILENNAEEIDNLLDKVYREMNRMKDLQIETGMF